MRKILFLLLVIPCAAFCQGPKIDRVKTSHGIHFETGLSWEEIQAKARAENKFIFMDCYATWCGPCRYMSDSVFTQEEVGQYMNDRFISVAVQIDRTSKDGENIRKWYEDAGSIAKQYSIEILPTYLFFAPDGHAVHKFVGATGKEGKDFIAKADESLDPNKQYFTLQENYKLHLNDPAFLRNALISSLSLEEEKRAESISDDLVRCLQGHYTDGDLVLMFRAVQSSKDMAFPVVLNNAARIDNVLRDGNPAEQKISNIIATEEILPVFAGQEYPRIWERLIGAVKTKYPALNESATKSLYTVFENQILAREIRLPLYKGHMDTVDWTKIADQIKVRYPGYNPEKIIAKEKPRYYAYKKMWDECGKAAVSYVEKYRTVLGKSELNAICWDYAFMHSDDRSLVLKALEWCKSIMPDPSDTEAYKYSGTYECIDTYANLLYKSGDKENAILWEKKAIELVDKFPPDSVQTSYRITVERMERGESTWEGREGPYAEYRRR